MRLHQIIYCIHRDPRLQPHYNRICVIAKCVIARVQCSFIMEKKITRHWTKRTGMMQIRYEVNKWTRCEHMMIETVINESAAQ